MAFNEDTGIMLHCGDASAKIQLRGGQIASWKTPDGRERLWQADPAVWAQHAPVLFPVCGSVKDGVISIGGEKYAMPKHGFTRNPDFRLVRKGSDFAELVLTPTEESRPLYPFEFAFHVTYTLKENGYRTAFLVENLSDRPMPFCVGGHPGFICPMEPDSRFEDYELLFPEKEDGWNALAPGGGYIDGGETLECLRDEGRIPLRHEWFDTRDALVLTHVKSRSVLLVRRGTRNGLRFDFPKMEVLAVWSKPGAHADYVCLEPWHGMPDTADATGRFEDKPFVTILAPGEAWQGEFEATLIRDE